MIDTHKKVIRYQVQHEPHYVSNPDFLANCTDLIDRLETCLTK